MNRAREHTFMLSGNARKRYEIWSHPIFPIIKKKKVIWNIWSQFKQKFDRLSVFQSRCLVIQTLAFAFVVWGIKGLTDSLLIWVQVRCLALGPPCLSAFISRQHPEWGHSCRATLCVLSDFCSNQHFSIPIGLQLTVILYNWLICWLFSFLIN